MLVRECLASVVATLVALATCWKSSKSTSSDRGHNLAADPWLTIGLACGPESNIVDGEVVDPNAQET